MAPPADELVWTPYMSGSWYDESSDGSGAYLDVLPDINAVSMAWFTWDNVAPPPDPNPDVADPGTRWLTALGFFDGSNPVVEMTVYGSTGGIFNTGAPVTSASRRNNDTGDVQLLRRWRVQLQPRLGAFRYREDATCRTFQPGRLC